MLVVSIALVAVLLSGRGDAGNAEVASSVGTPVLATPTSTPEPTATPEPTPAPSIPFALQERVNALPQKLRNQSMHAYATGSLSLEQLEQIVSDYENRNPNVRVGSVLGVNDGTLRFEVFTTGEVAHVEATELTLVQRGDDEITLPELWPDELIMVVSTDDGRIAVTIEAFGVSAP